jgi:hypothetical protein
LKTTRSTFAIWTFKAQLKISIAVQIGAGIKFPAPYLFL